MTDPTDSEFDPPPSLSPQELARWETRGIPELTELLYWRWDPIGVSWAFPSAADEYHHYAKPLIDSLHTGASPQDIASALHEFERTWITLETSDERRLEVAALVAVGAVALVAIGW